jgi:hypothetical protein
VNNALSAPLQFSIVPNAPGVLSAMDGTGNSQNGSHLIAQHTSTGTLLMSGSPAKPGGIW